MPPFDEGRTPNVVTGFQVRYASAEDEFTTYQTFQPTDGRHYFVKAIKPVIFTPTPKYRIETSIAEAPLVVAKEGSFTAFQLNDAIQAGLVLVADRWENPVSASA